MPDALKQIKEFPNKPDFGDEDLLLIQGAGTTYNVRGTAVKTYAENAAKPQVELAAQQAASSQEAATRAEAAIQHPAIPDPVSGNWKVWDQVSGSYQETVPPVRAEGRDFEIRGYYQTIEELEAAVPEPEKGWAYGIGTEAPYDIYVWDVVHGAWVNNGPLTASGDMLKSMYDPQHKEQDVFAYAEAAHVGKSMAGQTVEPTQGTTVTAGAGAEVFNDYRARTYGPLVEGDTKIVALAGNIAKGEKSHAEGFATTALGHYSHAEGQRTSADGQGAHSEGWNCIADGHGAHAEGWGTKATVSAAHSEGKDTVSSHNASHSEGTSTKASGGSAHSEGNMTTASGESSHAEGKLSRAIGLYAHAEGFLSEADGESSHSEGVSAKAVGKCSHAEGYYTESSGENSHAEGYRCTSSGKYSHAEGEETVAGSAEFPSQTEGAHAEGYKTKAGVNASSSYTWEAPHAEGSKTTADGRGAHAEGWETVAKGTGAHAEGWETVAKGDYSHAGGWGTVAAASYQTSIGSYNVESTTTLDKLIVGKGISTARSNCFRVTSSGVYASGSYNASGADYAEMFEWADGNPDHTDLAGRFVTLDGRHIRLAGPGEGYILGIVSGNPSVVGDVYDDQWQGMYLTDVYGRPVFEDVEVPDLTETVEVPVVVLGEGDEAPRLETRLETRVVIPAHTERRQKLNPAYDPGQPYVPRSQRPEWDAVGLLGKLVAVDDGTCQVNGWATVAEGGAATASQEPTKFRVMERLDGTHVRIMIL